MITEPSTSGASAKNESAPAMCSREARSERSAYAIASTAAPAQSPISTWNRLSYRSKPGFPIAGTANAGSAPGGYSIRKSR